MTCNDLAVQPPANIAGRTFDTDTEAAISACIRAHVSQVSSTGEKPNTGLGTVCFDGIGLIILLCVCAALGFGAGVYARQLHEK